MNLSTDGRAARRARLAAGTAVVLHGAFVLLAIRFGAQPARPGGPRVDTTRQTVEVEIAEEIGEAMSDPTVEDMPGVATSGSFPRAPLAVRSANGEPTVDVQSREVQKTAEPMGSSAPVLLFDPSPSPASLAIGAMGPNPFLGGSQDAGAAGASSSSTFVSATPDAPKAAEAKRSADRWLRNGLAERDAALGLGPSGPVVSALREATRGSLAPERGSATFLAVVDASGFVVGLRLVGSTGGDGWESARDDAARSLATVRLALRGAKGAELTIVVESDVVLPSGAKPAMPIQPSLSDSKVQLSENVPAGGTAGVVKTHTVGRFDLADIGAKPRRVVRARLLSLSTM